MTRLFEWFRPFIRRVARRPSVILVPSLLLSILGGYLGSNLRVDADFSKLLPPDHPSVAGLERLRKTVGGENPVVVVIESPSFAANKRFAEALIPRALELVNERKQEPFFTRVDYRRDVEFLESSALYLATPGEIDKLEAYLEKKATEAKLDANPLFVDLSDDDDDEEAEDDALTEAELKAFSERVLPKEYPASDDGRTLVVRLYTTQAQTNIRFIENCLGALGTAIDELDPTSYDGTMTVDIGGRLFRQLLEVRAITDDIFKSFGAGVASVLLLVTGYFFYKSYQVRKGSAATGKIIVSEILRMPVTGAVVGIPLLMSLSWTFGLAWLQFETLNLMTSTLALVLFGLGIDYGIHFFARYAEERGEGKSVAIAIEETFTLSGPPIAVSALSTAAALYVLSIAEFRGFSEFGGIAGSGIIFALVAMTFTLPGFLVMFERLGLMNLEVAEAQATQTVSKSSSTRPLPLPRLVVLVSLVAVVATVALLDHVQFQYDFSKLDPKYPEYSRVQSKFRKVFKKTGRNPAYVVVDSPDEVPAVVKAVRRKITADTETPTILKVESLQERFPLDDKAKRRKLDRVADIRDLLDDPFIKADDSDDLNRLRKASQVRKPIPLDELPDHLRRQFTSRDGELGNYVMIYPSVGLSDGRRSMQFTDDVTAIETEDGRTYRAASTSIVAATMLRLMLDESPTMVVLTLVATSLLMVLIFASVRWAALALIPLGVGVLWMLGVMELIGLHLNFYNLVVLPAVIGIGNDCGVHIVHRYREEGPGSLRKVLASTGEHVTIGALTTMIGFAGLLLSFHPGLESIGLLAVVGIGATLLSALLFLPALLQWLENRGANA